VREEQERVGLCARCRHAQRVRSGKGSVFFLCRMSQVDPRFPKYPNLPVRACAGFEEEGRGPDG